ncbi:unnamed protein product, partial [marine sediment metagenome]
ISQVVIDNMEVDKWLAIHILGNGTTVLVESYSFVCVDDISGSVLVNKTLELFKSDFIELFVRHNNIAAKEVGIDLKDTYLVISRIALNKAAMFGGNSSISGKLSMMFAAIGARTSSISSERKAAASTLCFQNHSA